MPATTPSPGYVTSYAIDHSADARAKLKSLSRRARAFYEALSTDELNDQARRAAERERAEKLRQEGEDLNLRKASMAREIDRSNTLPKIRHVDPDTGAVAWVPNTNWAHEIDLRLAEIKGEREKLLNPPRSENQTGKILEWLGTSSGIYTDAQLPAVILPKNQTVPYALKQARKATDAAKAERRRIEQAPRTKAEVEAKVLKELASIARKGRPLVSSAFRGGRINDHGNFEVKNPNARISFPRIRTGASGNHFEPHSVPDGLAVLVWLHHDAIRDKLVAEIESHDDSLAISETEKPRMLREADAAILAAQRYEEATVVLAQSQGVTVKRRQTPIIVLLGIQRADESSLGLQPTAAQVAAPESITDDAEFEGEDDLEVEFG
jgi:hypothetical protein